MPSMTTIVATPDAKPKGFLRCLVLTVIPASVPLPLALVLSQFFGPPPMGATIKVGVFVATVCLVGATALYALDRWLVCRTNRSLAEARRHAAASLAASTEIAPEAVAAAIRDAMPSPERIEEGVRAALTDTLRPLHASVAELERNSGRTIH